MSMAFLGAMIEAHEQTLEQALRAMQIVAAEPEPTTDEIAEEAEIAEVAV